MSEDALSEFKLKEYEKPLAKLYEIVDEITIIKQVVADRHSFRIITDKVQHIEGIKPSQLSPSH